jgi:hypothetical protein
MPFSSISSDFGFFPFFLVVWDLYRYIYLYIYVIYLYIFLLSNSLGNINFKESFFSLKEKKGKKQE